MTNSQGARKGRAVTTDTEMRFREREIIIAVFTRELPHTARIMNPAVVTEEIVFGPDYEVPDDIPMPPQEWYDRHEEIMDELVADGILQTGDYLGMTGYGLTIAYQDTLRATVMNYLEQQAKLLKDKGDPSKAVDAAKVALQLKKQ